MRPCETCEAAMDGLCLARLSDQPTVTEYTADGIFVAEIRIAAAGTFTPQHEHVYDHITHLAQGSIRLHRDAMPTEDLTAPLGILIKANTRHLFETVTDDVLLLCVHNTARTGAVEVAREYQLVLDGEA